MVEKVLLLNQNWFAEELRAYGYEVFSVGGNYTFDYQLEYPLPPIKNILSCISDKFRPDLVIYHDDSAQATCTGFGELDIPSIFYSVDTHHHCQWHSYYGRGFDQMLVAQKDYLEAVRQRNPQASFLPLWCSVEYSYPGIRDIDVSFRGNFDKKLNPKRVKFFDELQKLVSVDAGMGHFKDIYTRSKIVINQAVKTDLNFRIFEALVSGAMLLTPKLTNGFSELFTDGEHLVTYEANNASDAADKISYYLQNEKLRKQIASAGYEEARTNHTAFARAREFHQFIESIDTNRPVKKGYNFGDAITLFLNCKGAKTRFPDFCKLLAARAKDKLTAGLTAGEELDDILCVVVVSLAELLIEFGLEEEAAELVLMFSEAYPEQQILPLVSIRNMKMAGYSAEQIFSYASSKFSDSGEAVERSEKIVSDYLQAIS